jgi:hypothetical protein
MKSRIVVARYNEDIEWLSNYDNVTIYNKGEKVQTKHEVIELPNIGREAHTIFHHICKNYDNLDDLTVFLPGNPFDHFKHRYHIENQMMAEYFIRTQLLQIPKDFYMSNNYTPFHLGEVFDGMLSIDKSTLPIDYPLSDTISVKMKITWHDWWKTYIDPNELIDYKKWTRIFWHSMFSIKKEAILSNSKDYYKRCLESFDDVYTIEVNYFESAWSYVFNNIDDLTLVDLGHSIK